MSNVSFEKKLEVMAKAFFRDRDPVEDAEWLTWQDVLADMRNSVSEKFVETCYEMNKNDPELNTELVGDA